MASKEFDERHPFGKGATIITQDNITYAQAARAARQRIRNGTASADDVLFVNEREALIQKAVREK